MSPGTGSVKPTDKSSIASGIIFILGQGDVLQNIRFLQSL